MKKSHRKDVIIARIIFAFIVVILIALIVFGIKAIMKYRADKGPTDGTQTQVTETTSSESETAGIPDADDNSEWIVDDTENGNTEDTQTTEQPQETQTPEEEQPQDTEVTLKAMYGVNIRSGAGTDNAILGSVPEGDTAILLEERDDGWGYVQYGDLTGYVYLEYFLILDPAE